MSVNSCFGLSFRLVGTFRISNGVVSVDVLSLSCIVLVTVLFLYFLNRCLSCGEGKRLSGLIINGVVSLVGIASVLSLVQSESEDIIMQSLSSLVESLSSFVMSLSSFVMSLSSFVMSLSRSVSGM